MKKDIEPDIKKFAEEYTADLLKSLQPSQITYEQKRKAYEIFPKWHVLANEINKPERIEKKSRVVYSETKEHISQNARDPLLTVPQTMGATPVLGHLFYRVNTVNGMASLAQFPSVIYPHECWVVYGYVFALETLRSEYEDEVIFRADCSEINADIKAFYLQEYNPAVSLSYIWGNPAYRKMGFGLLSDALVPDRTEYAQGIIEYHQIIDELQDDDKV